MGCGVCLLFVGFLYIPVGLLVWADFVFLVSRRGDCVAGVCLDLCFGWVCFICLLVGLGCALILLVGIRGGCVL